MIDFESLKAICYRCLLVLGVMEGAIELLYF